MQQITVTKTDAQGGTASQCPELLEINAHLSLFLSHSPFLSPTPLILEAIVGCQTKGFSSEPLNVAPIPLPSLSATNSFYPFPFSFIYSTVCGNRTGNN